MHVHTVYLYKNLLRGIHIQIQKFTSAFIWYNCKKKKKKTIGPLKDYFMSRAKTLQRQS